MLVSGGKVLAVDKVKTDEKVFTGDGAFNPIGLKIEQPIDKPYGYNPALEKWVEVADAGDIGIDKVSHDKTLVGDGNTNKLGINLSDAIDPEKVYGFKQDGSMAEVATTSMVSQPYSFANTDSILVNVDDANKQISFDAVGGVGSAFSSSSKTEYNKNEQTFYYIPMIIETATSSWGNDGILHIVVENT